jgi:hypothetical protein
LLQDPTLAKILAPNESWKGSKLYVLLLSTSPCTFTGDDGFSNQDNVQMLKVVFASAICFKMVELQSSWRWLSCDQV